MSTSEEPTVITLDNTNSIQRFVDAFDVVTYVSTVPTPRQLNDCSGIVLNGILMTLTFTASVVVILAQLFKNS